MGKFESYERVPQQQLWDGTRRTTVEVLVSASIILAAVEI